MKKIIIIITTLIILLSSCKREQVSQNKPSINNGDPNYKIEIIDGCEYIIRENNTPLSNSYSFSITHKGNCKNHK